MPKAKTRTKIKDKWREKKWVVIEAPTPFGNTPVAYVPLTTDETAIGRVVETTLFDLQKQDPQQYAIKLYFQIDKVGENKAQTIMKGHEYSKEYLRSMVRRGSSMVNFIRDYQTKDGFLVRVYVVVFTQGRINSSKKHALRLAADEIVRKKTEELNYNLFCKEVVEEKVAAGIQEAAKKISQVRKVGIRKTKLIRRPGETVNAPPEEEEEAVEAVAA
ncbi:MAG: 30S ribosomal protein S3ae [Thaumarchaeota archaeon]|nr:30S ribosomal protein S3ae [Nitrososphaerota archaeon]